MARGLRGRELAGERRIHIHPEMFRNAGFTGAAQKDPFSRNEVNGFERKPNCYPSKS
jgi:hypothetical protein